MMVMNKTERHNLRKKGIIALRSTYDAGRGYWKITEYTISGGWRMFGKRWYNSGAICQGIIQDIVARDPEHYILDEGN
jgi:hypothetical protein